MKYSVPIRRTAIKYRKKPIPKEIREHWQRLIDMGCVVTGGIASIHHCHGGSIIDEFGYKQNPGMGQRQNHWLTIPLHPRLHYLEGGIDYGMGKQKGVEQWEAKNGRQTDYLRLVRDRIFERFGYCIFERAGLRDSSTTECGD